MNFKEITGQEKIKAHLTGAIKAGKVSHAYILAGERGSGKKSIAKAFSKTLLCDEKGLDACCKCESCRKTENDNNPDLINIYKDPEKTVLGVDEIKDNLVNTVDYKPYEHDRKIYIVHDAHLMNEVAQNALLKTIEEPPSYITIILLSENADTFLPTILSRCIRLNISPLPDDVIEKEVIKRTKTADYLAREAAAFSRGNLGKAIRLTESSEFLSLKESLIKTVRRIYELSDSDLMDAAKNLSENRDDLKEFISMLQIWYRDVLLYKSVQTEDKLIFKGDAALIKKTADRLSYRSIEKNLSCIEDADGELKANVSPHLLTYILLQNIKEN